MLTLTCPVETPLHRWPAGAKLAGMIAVIAGLFVLPHPGVLLVALCGLAAVYLWAGGWTLLVFGLRLLWPLWPFVVVVGGWHLLRGSPEVGALVNLRMLGAVLTANLMTMTTRLDCLIDLITRLCSPLAWIGVPPRRAALTLALVIRFVPVLGEAAAGLALAWRARSARRPGLRLLAPLTLAAIDEADHVAEALRARGGLG